MSLGKIIIIYVNHFSPQMKVWIYIDFMRYIVAVFGFIPYDEILADKITNCAEYRKQHFEMRQLLTAKANVDQLLGYDERTKQIHQTKETPVH